MSELRWVRRYPAIHHTQLPFGGGTITECVGDPELVLQCLVTHKDEIDTWSEWVDVPIAEQPIAGKTRAGGLRA